MATTRPTSNELCAFTDPDIEDAGRAYSAPFSLTCAAPSGLTIGEEVETTYDASGNPVFAEVAAEEGDVSGGIFDVAIHSVEDLADIATTGIEIGSASAVKQWIDDATDTVQTWQLEVGTDAHDPLNGVCRPDDYNVLTNAKVWYFKAAP